MTWVCITTCIFFTTGLTGLRVESDGHRQLDATDNYSVPRRHRRQFCEDVTTTDFFGPGSDGNIDANRTVRPQAMCRTIYL